MDAKTSVLLSQQKQFFIDARSRPIGAKDKNNQDAKRRKCVGQSGGEKLQSHPGVQHSALTLRTVCLLLENVESQESIGAEPPQLLHHCYAATLFSFLYSKSEKSRPPRPPLNPPLKPGGGAVLRGPPNEPLLGARPRPPRGAM